MATTTPTRTLADVMRVRLEDGDPGDTLATALNKVIGIMAPYAHAGDLRPSEVEWLDEVAGTISEAAKNAALDVILEAYPRTLRRLIPPTGLYAGGNPDDATVPQDLWVHGGDQLREDLAVLSGEAMP